MVSMLSMFKSIIIAVSFSLLLTSTVSAQKYSSKNGRISFYSETAVEKIEAENTQVNSALDIATGDFVFKTLIRGFEFQKALMQEHFNENYMESDKYPNATFNGKVTNLKDINLAKDGKYNVTVDGDLTMHGVIKKISVKGTMEVKAGSIFADSKFNVLIKDYDIKIPNTVINNISESIEIKVSVELKKLTTYK
jgi:polyisoprenoid-binding protein YceI